MPLKPPKNSTSKYCTEKGGLLLDNTLTPTSSACSIAAEEYIEDCNDALARLSATENSSTVSSASENDDIIGSSMKDKHINLKARHRSLSKDLKKQKKLGLAYSMLTYMIGNGHLKTTKIAELAR